jgi:hypothetical protein
MVPALPVVGLRRVSFPRLSRSPYLVPHEGRECSVHLGPRILLAKFPRQNATCAVYRGIVETVPSELGALSDEGDRSFDVFRSRRGHRSILLSPTGTGKVNRSGDQALSRSIISSDRTCMSRDVQDHVSCLERQSWAQYLRRVFAKPMHPSQRTSEGTVVESIQPLK